jgi:hypothetical protein
MFFYLLKNSTLIDPDLEEQPRNTQILIYGTVAYIVLHATLFIGGKDALLNCLKPYFWLFLFLDIGIVTINSDIDVLAVLQQNKLHKSINSNNEISNINNTQTEEQIDDVFNSFLKESEIDGNEKIRENNRKAKMGNPHIKRRGIVKKVTFEDENSSSSDSDIGTDIDLESFKESLNI